MTPPQGRDFRRRGPGGPPRGGGPGDPPPRAAGPEPEHKSVHRLPLYDSAPARVPEARGDGNAGLWWAKFVDKWKRDWSGLLDPGKGKEQEKTRPGGKPAWLHTLTQPGNGSIGEAAALRAARDRRQELVAKQGGASGLAVADCWHELALESPFVTGMGLDHPVENGFLWHHTLGVPYLPGSGVKGLVAAWADLILTEQGSETDWHLVTPAGKALDEQAQDTAFLRIFGRKTRRQQERERALPRAEAAARSEEPTQVGSVIFLDALPVRPVELTMEVMTPHYTPWYQASDPAAMPPADWYDPNPIPFLAVKQASFAFALLPNPLRPGRGGGVAPEKPARDVRQVASWLEDALSWLCAGAKTAVGFGRFGTGTVATPSEAVTAAPPVAEPPPDRTAELAREFPRGSWVYHQGEEVQIVGHRAGRLVVDAHDGEPAREVRPEHVRRE